MKISYNEIDKTIDIKDGVKTNYFIMKFLMILNLINAIIRLFKINKTGIGLQEIIWFVLGFASLLILFIFVFKRTTSEKIPIEQIKGLNEKSIIGRRSFYIKLLNGKKRELNELKTKAEFNKLKKMFAEIGIDN